MPSTDRYWPYVLAAVTIYTAAIVGGITWILATTLPLDSALGISPWSELTCNNLVFIVLIAVFVPTFFAWCYQARIRMRRRLRAVSGDLEAIPLARDTPRPDDAPDVAIEPLILAWRPLASSAGMALLFVPVLVAMFVVVPLAALGLFLALTHFGVRNVQIDLVAALGLMVVGVLGGLLLLYKIAHHKRASTRAVRLSASGDGLRWERGVTAREIPWYEARVLELWCQSGARANEILHGYTLYGLNDTITWRIPSPLRVVPEGMTANDLARRESHLLDLIAAKSHLTPRTFVKSPQS